MEDIYEKYVGLVFDNRYRIERVIGVGGMAIVFKATDLLMRRVVAVKILKDEISTDEQSVKRFSNESKAVAMLSHQNIVNVYDVSTRENIKYIVMEFVEGITLKNYLKHREVLNIREIISYTTQILRALDHAHKKGIVHRDIKPQNIMLLKNGIIKVMDFGIAKLPNAETVTMTDKAIGTVYYISPEQVSGGDSDARSDIYSLGVMMYEMATGSLPFTAETPVSVALMQVNDTATPPTEVNPHIPQGLEQIICKAMEKDPDERYQSAEEMLGQLLKLRENPNIIFKEKNSKNKQKKKDKEARRKKKTSHSMFPIIMGVTFAFLIVAGISGYYMLDRLFFNSTMNDYANLTIQNFVGATYTDELAEWFKNSENYKEPTIIYQYSDTVEKGRIVSQEPLPDEIRKVLPGKQKCEITLSVSQGAKTITLADYTVRDYRMVESELRRLGLTVKVENISNDVYQIGYVIKTEPAAGTVMHENDTVTIYVSHGSDTVKTNVPNFIGLSEARALITLMENKLTIGRVTYEKSDWIAGTVMEQSLTAWREVPQFTAVDFVISGGASYSGDGTTVPTKEDMKWGQSPEDSDSQSGSSSDGTTGGDDIGFGSNDSDWGFEFDDSTDWNSGDGTDGTSSDSSYDFGEDDWFTPSDDTGDTGSGNTSDNDSWFDPSDGDGNSDSSDSDDWFKSADDDWFGN